jgi:hypothetical protein
MSIGFTIPLIMIAQQPGASSEDIGLITALFSELSLTPSQTQNYPTVEAKTNRH